MNGRIFLTEQEIEEKYGKPIIIIGERWAHSCIYYDSANDQFIEERYHEEYLDTGTVCDGCYIISDGYLWKKLVRTCDEEGMATYLKYRNHIPETFETDKTVTKEEFLEGLNALVKNNPSCQYFCKETGSMFVITNESNTILCKIGKADNYYFFFNPNSDVQKQGFQSLEEAFAEALYSVTLYHKYRPENKCSEHLKKKGFFARLFKK